MTEEEKKKLKQEQEEGKVEEPKTDEPKVEEPKVEDKTTVLEKEIAELRQALLEKDKAILKKELEYSTLQANVSESKLEQKAMEDRLAVFQKVEEEKLTQEHTDFIAMFNGITEQDSRYTTVQAIKDEFSFPESGQELSQEQMTANLNKYKMFAKTKVFELHQQEQTNNNGGTINTEDKKLIVNLAHPLKVPPTQNIATRNAPIPRNDSNNPLFNQ